ncbi:MAG TPA: hypothetical protein VGC41_13410 [Kofleriaceae bacterium]
MRLGELLISAGVLVELQLEEALHAQVMWGARLGTVLVEMGMIDLDGLSNALGNQQGLPAALASHFDSADRQLQMMLSPTYAERFGCVPLRRVGKRAAAVAITSPLTPKEIAIVGDELGVDPDRLIFAIAPELRIRYALERVYTIARPQRFLRAPGSIPSTPRQVPLPNAHLDLEDAVPEPLSRESTSERRRYVEPLLAPPRTKTGPITPRSGTLVDANALLDVLRTSSREQVAQLAIEAVDHLCRGAEAAVLLTPRSDVATSWTSFRRDRRLLPPIAVPMQGMIAVALRTKQQQRAVSTALGPVDQLLFVTLGLTRGELVVTPLVARDRKLAVLVAGGAGELDSALLAAIAAAAAEGFARLMTEATK